MKRVEIDISKASLTDLQLECIRLGIEISELSGRWNMQQKLYSYEQNRAVRDHWLELTALLWPGNYDGTNVTTRTMRSDIYNRLYRRLHEEGFVPKTLRKNAPMTRDAAQQFKLLKTENGNEFLILHRVSDPQIRIVIFRADSPQGTYSYCHILRVAEYAFPDVTAAFKKWKGSAD